MAVCGACPGDPSVARLAASAPGSARLAPPFHKGALRPCGGLGSGRPRRAAPTQGWEFVGTSGVVRCGSLAAGRDGAPYGGVAGGGVWSPRPTEVGMVRSSECLPAIPQSRLCRDSSLCTREPWGFRRLRAAGEPLALRGTEGLPQGGIIPATMWGHGRWAYPAGRVTSSTPEIWCRRFITSRSCC